MEKSHLILLELIAVSLLAAPSSCYPYEHMRNMRSRRVPNPRQIYQSQSMLIRGRRGKGPDDRQIPYLGNTPLKTAAASSYGYQDLSPVDVEPSADRVFQQSERGFPQSPQQAIQGNRPGVFGSNPSKPIPDAIRSESGVLLRKPGSSPLNADSSNQGNVVCDRSACTALVNCLNQTETDCCPKCVQVGCHCEGYQAYDCKVNGYEQGVVPEGESFPVDDGSTICTCPKGGGSIMCSYYNDPSTGTNVGIAKLACPAVPTYCIEVISRPNRCSECRAVGCQEEDGTKHPGGASVKKPDCKSCFCPTEGGLLICTVDQACTNDSWVYTSQALHATQRVYHDPIDRSQQTSSGGASKENSVVVPPIVSPKTTNDQSLATGSGTNLGGAYPHQRTNYIPSGRVGLVGGYNRYPYDNSLQQSPPYGGGSRFGLNGHHRGGLKTPDRSDAGGMNADSPGSSEPSSADEKQPNESADTSAKSLGSNVGRYPFNGQPSYPNGQGVYGRQQNYAGAMPNHNLNGYGYMRDRGRPMLNYNQYYPYFGNPPYYHDAREPIKAETGSNSPPNSNGTSLQNGKTSSFGTYSETGGSFYVPYQKRVVPIGSEHYLFTPEQQRPAAAYPSLPSSSGSSDVGADVHTSSSERPGGQTLTDETSSNTDSAAVASSRRDGDPSQTGETGTQNADNSGRAQTNLGSASGTGQNVQQPAGYKPWPANLNGQRPGGYLYGGNYFLHHGVNRQGLNSGPALQNQIPAGVPGHGAGNRLLNRQYSHGDQNYYHNYGQNSRHGYVVPGQNHFAVPNPGRFDGGQSYPGSSVEDSLPTTNEESALRNKTELSGGTDGGVRTSAATPQSVRPAVIPLRTYLSPSTTLVSVTSNDRASFENVLSVCCVQGQQWAIDHDTCSGIPVNVDSYGQICALAQSKCCMQAKNVKGCRAGIQTARSMEACDAHSEFNGFCETDGFRPCCECCGLGLKAFSLGLSCKIDILGEPCNGAYSECCEKGMLSGSGREFPVRPSPAGGNPAAPTLAIPTAQNEIEGVACPPEKRCSHYCVDSPEGVKCACRAGYQLDGDEHGCSDINECVLGTHTCGEGQLCFNTVGKFNCQRRVSCGTGYELTDKNTCDDIDECALKLHNCHAKMDCVNVRGSFRCIPKTCDVGYITDAVGGCTDIDECVGGDFFCPPHARCENTQGSYTCLCANGLVFNSERQVCDDIDECDLGISDCQEGSTCINTRGSFTCRDPPRLSCDPGYRRRDGQCVDIDECVEGSHSCAEGSTCINVVGGFSCQDPITCRPGTRPSANQRSCIDINECDESTDECGEGGVCVNLQGSYRCECRRGFRQSRNATSGVMTCRDIDECALPVSRPCQYKCVNTPGGYACVCPRGYSLSRLGRKCNDIDECALRQDNCNSTETCFNTRGGFKCQQLTCSAGYAKIDKRRRCIRESCKGKRGRSLAECRKQPKQISYHNISVLNGTKPGRSIFRFKFLQKNRKSASVFRLRGDKDNFFEVENGRRRNFRFGGVRIAKTLKGPRQFVIELSLNIIRRLRVTSLVSRLFIYVSPYSF